MAQLTFARNEKKYIIPASHYDEVRECVNSHMDIDRVYPVYTLCNVYYDSPEFELARRSVERPIFKEKLRLRSYGTPARDGKVFVETKSKYKGVVYKRRASMSCDEAERFISSHIPPGDSQILREIDYFARTFRLVPKVYIAYDRVAYSGRDDPSLRLTFDSNIRYRTDRLHLWEGDDGTPLITDGSYLMEIKASDAVPEWVVEMFEQYSIMPASFSKYGKVYKILKTTEADHA